MICTLSTSTESITDIIDLTTGSTTSIERIVLIDRLKMACDRPPYVPRLGEIVWLSDDLVKYEGIKRKLPDWAPTHLALVMHVTINEKDKPRHAWILPVSSTIWSSSTEAPNVHFQYDCSLPVKDHDLSTCSDDCRKVLYLKPIWGGKIPAMRKAGYLDTSKVYEVPLGCLKRHLDRNEEEWYIRDCSFSLVADMAKDAIAECMTSWQPQHETEMLWQKLDPKHLKTRGLVCWVEPVSKKLIDRNGTSYAGSGPCIFHQHNPKGAVIGVVLNHRRQRGDTRGFVSLENDNEKISVPIETSMSDAPEYLSYVWPEGSSRTTYAADHFLVCGPGFIVPHAELCWLPPCFLPPGTRTRYHSKSYTEHKSSVLLCKARRETRDKEKNRLEAQKREIERLEAANELEEARRLAARRNRELLQRTREAAKQKHKALLQQVVEGLMKVKVRLAGLSELSQIAGSDNRPPWDHEESAKLSGWLETEILLCAALASLKQNGPVSPVDNLVDKPNDQSERSKLEVAVCSFIADFGWSPPSIKDRTTLRDVLKLTAQQCDPLLMSMKLLPKPKWEDFITKQEAETDSGSGNSSGESDGASEVSTDQESDNATEMTTSSDEIESPSTKPALVGRPQSNSASVARLLLSYLLRLATLSENTAPVVDETLD